MAEHTHRRLANKQIAMNTKCSFVAYLPSFNFGEPALLLSVDNQTMEWMMSRFEHLASAEPGDSSFVVGDGNPIASDGRCLLTVQKAAQEQSTRLTHAVSGEFRWSISPSSARHFRALLSGLLKSKAAGHQYLDSDDPSSPVVIVSKGEYEPEKIRGWLQLRDSAANDRKLRR